LTTPLGGSGGVSSPSTTDSPTVFKVMPKVTGFSPASARVGDSVTITGMNFANLSSVKFGAAVANVLSSTDTQIVVTVPPTAPLLGKITVTTVDGTGTSVNNFTLIKPPTVT